jgi:chorismate synthase
MLNHWDCRVLHNVDDMKQFVDLEIAIWELDPRDAVPTSLLHAMSMNGSLVIGAYDQEEMIGMAFAFPVPRGKKQILWSHMAGVKPAYQGKGIGFALKQFQRNWALERGYDAIAWTFDPLQRGNANFNLHVLGASAQIYHVNLYGEMADGINAGLPSDRLEVIWNLRDKRVKQLAVGRSGISDLDVNLASSFFLQADNHNQPIQNNLPSDLPSPCLIEIPGDLAGLKQMSPQAALNWRLALRQALETAFASGYSATDFVVLGGRYCYVLTLPQSWFLYVLECSDQSLYTGITPDLQRRLKRHNAGRGAAYTAAHRPVKLIGAWRFYGRSAALKAEAHFKNYSHRKKLELVNQGRPFRNAAFFIATKTD